MKRTITTIVVGLTLALVGTAAIAGVKFKSSTTLLPPNPLPPGVAANGHGRAQIEVEPGIKERLKLELQDIEVIGDAADPAFCHGFYEVVLSSADRLQEFKLPAFAGVVADCVVPGDPQGPTVANRNFDAKLVRGQEAVNPAGKLLSIWEVAPVRDPITLAVIPGPNGEPFIIAERKVVALEGILQ